MNAYKVPNVCQFAEEDKEKAIFTSAFASPEAQAQSWLMDKSGIHSMQFKHEPEPRKAVDPGIPVIDPRYNLFDNLMKDSRQNFSKPKVEELELFNLQAQRAMMGNFFPSKSEPLIESTMIINLKTKLEEILKLPFKWDTYSAKTISQEAANEVLIFLTKIEKQFTEFGKPLSDPEIVPLPSGGIQLEWATEKGELEIEFHGNETFPLLFTPPNPFHDEEVENADMLTAISFVMKLFGGGKYV